MRDAAAANGWTFVSDPLATFNGHGYCSAQSWIVRLQESYRSQGDRLGALHPNAEGQEALARALVRAVPEPGAIASPLSLSALASLALLGRARRAHLLAGSLVRWLAGSPHAARDCRSVEQGELRRLGAAEGGGR